MGRVVALVVGVCGVLALLSGCTMPAPFRVMSFNIRTAQADDGPNAWAVRRDLVVETIQVQQPDILGLQEVVATQAAELRAALPGYGFVGVGRDDGAEQGEFVPIMFRRERFTLVDSGYFWLSAHPEQAGSVGWDAALPRLATWVRLRFNDAPLTEVEAINVHFDHQGTRARVESARLVRRVVESLGGRPVVVLGDFNCAPGSMPYQVLTHNSGNLAELADTQPRVATAPAGGTFHGFTGKAEGGRIDWILVNRFFEPLEAGIDRRDRAGRYPSDHFPVTATLKMVPASCGPG